MIPRTPKQRADAILVALRTAPLAALYWWRCVPLDEHESVCGHLGEVALKRLMQIQNEHSAQPLSDLADLIPPEMECEIEQVLRRDLAAIEKKARLRIVASR